MNALKGIMLWMISPFYFTYRFLEFMFIDFWDSLKDNLYEEYYDSYKDLYKKTKRVYKGEVDWMGKSLKDNDIKQEDIYKG